VFAITAGAFVPLNFLAVRLAEAYTHPRVLSATGGQMPGSMRLTFLVSLLAMALLFATLFKLELAAKNVARQLRRLRRSAERAAGREPAPAPAARDTPTRGAAVATTAAPPRGR
jgi:heme exporter protein C